MLLGGRLFSGRVEAPLSLFAPARAAAEFLFPSRCLACEARRVEEVFRGGVCADCWEAVPLPDSRRCDLCDEALPGEDAVRCGRCLFAPPEFTRLSAAAPYRSAARSILLAFKFRGADYLAPRLAEVMARRLPRAHPVKEVTAVPARRSAVGGYRPSAILGAAVARLLGRPFVPGLLSKVRENRRQSGLPLAARAANVRGAFRARRPDGNVLLVDDVATSGATARECARVLAKAGAESVSVWCFARASKSDVTDFEFTEGEERSLIR